MAQIFNPLNVYGFDENYTLQPIKFKTINGESILGSGDIEISGGSAIDAYSKSESDEKFATKSELGNKLDSSTYTSEKADFATKSELTAKLDSSTYESDKSTFATKSELGDKVDTSTYDSEKANFATKSELANKLDANTKASSNTLGSIKVGDGLQIDGDGKLSVTPGA